MARDTVAVETRERLAISRIPMELGGAACRLQTTDDIKNGQSITAWILFALRDPRVCLPSCCPPLRGQRRQRNCCSREERVVFSKVEHGALKVPNVSLRAPVTGGTVVSCHLEVE